MKKLGLLILALFILSGCSTKSSSTSTTHIVDKENSSSINLCLEACKKYTNRTSEECFDSCRK